MIAEWKPVCVLLRRTRLGLWLAGLGCGAIGLGALQDGTFLPTLALGVALTANLTAALSLAGPQAGRVSAMTLRHPASPLAIATGRWLAVTALAGLVTLGATLGVAYQSALGWREGMEAAWSAAGATLPMAACGLLATAECWRRRTP